MPRLFNREHHWIQHLDAFASNPRERVGLGRNTFTAVFASHRLKGSKSRAENSMRHAARVARTHRSRWDEHSREKHSVFSIGSVRDRGRIWQP
jgi:hypothetical protein